MAPIKAFLKEVKKAARKAVSETERLLKGFKSEIKVVDGIVTTLPVAKTKHGFTTIGEATVGRFNKIMREGNLPELIKVSGKNVPFTSVDSKAFKSLVSDTPELIAKEVGDLALSNKKKFPHLDLKEVDFPNMSKTAAKDVKKVESNMFKYFKQGTTIALTIGIVYVGVDWLTKSTAQRKGCFMLTTINGKTTSCKVQAYSCIGTGGTMCQSVLGYYNTTTVLIKIASLPDSDALKIKVAAAADVEVSKMQSDLAKMIDSKYSEMYEVIKDNVKNLPNFAICEISHPDIEKGVIPPCRLCSPSDNPISTTYIDPELYPDNVTFQCSINPSLLDTVADAAKNTGKDLLAGIGGGLMTLLKPLLFAALVIIAILIMVSITMRVFKGMGDKKSNPREDTAPLIPTNYQTMQQVQQPPQLLQMQRQF